MVFGVNLNWRFVGESVKAVMNPITTLASASVPKYATSTLFLREIAHILKGIVSVGWAVQAIGEQRDPPQRDEDI